MDEIEFKKRVRVAINKVAFERDFTNSTLASLLDSTATTISNYRTMKTMAKASFITRFCGLFECNKEWLLSGDGRPFLDSGDDSQEIFNKYFKIPSKTAKRIKAIEDGIVTSDFPQTSTVKSQPAPSQEFSISEDLTLAAKILESKTHYATALHLNIRSFAGALNDSSTLNGVLARLEDLEGKFDKMQLENSNLRDEIKKLKGNSGGSAPIVLARSWSSKIRSRATVSASTSPGATTIPPAPT